MNLKQWSMMRTMNDNSTPISSTLSFASLHVSLTTLHFARFDMQTWGKFPLTPFKIIKFIDKIINLNSTQKCK